MPSRPTVHRPPGWRGNRPREVRVHEHRPDAATRGYDSRWAKAREGYLRQHPLCVHCLARGQVVPATVVDHIVPHRMAWAVKSGNEQAVAEARRLFWNFHDNVQSLCKSCHDYKTATEDGGFGNPTR